jgi:imidazole glycerol-phosphate synthase subunit HisH
VPFRGRIVTTCEHATKQIAIVDYGLGNLFSVDQACRAIGLSASITSNRSVIQDADAVILPGVGAFGDAMDTLRRLDLVGVLRDVAATGRPMIGICLGVQLLMSVSYEFGRHEGLGLIPGEVVPLQRPYERRRHLKVPHVGWNRITSHHGAAATRWSGTPLQGVRDGEFMYFVHSYVVVPQDLSVVLSTTGYGDIEFCSSVRLNNIFACQFHPERSGRAGLEVYAGLRRSLETNDTVQRSV